ncbi:MAG: response regulator [Bdellovibrionales bacterium]|nr:response regulator [Bdellovibrionales bacterium]
MHSLQSEGVSEDGLTQSTGFLDSVIENIPDMVFVKDAKTLRFVRFNRAGEEMLGYSRKDLLGKGDFDFFPREQAEYFVQKDRDVLANRRVVDIPEEPISTKYGIRYLHTKKIPVYGKDGQPLYLLGISEDITERKAIESERFSLVQEQLARSEAEKTAERLQFLAESSAVLSAGLDLVATLESFAKLVTANFADWCEVVLLAESDKRIEHFVIANADPEKVDWAKKAREAFQIDWDSDYGTAKVIRTGRPELVTHFKRGYLDDKVTDLGRREAVRLLGLHSVMLVPMTYQNRVIGVITLGRSDNPIEFNEFDLALAGDLSRRAALAVENARLFRQAQEASKAKSAFLANMSHEIRTPLGAMLGFGDLLHESELSPLQKKYVSTIMKNGRQLLRIVDEILDLAKVESDRIAVEEVEFSLSTLLEEVFSLLEVQARDKALAFRVNMAEDLPERLVTDPSRLRQILINVIGNAIKFTKEGHVEVEVEMHLQPDGKRQLEIHVNDTGIGISKSQREKLFQPFVQAESSTARRFGGTGLGLSLSRRMARLLGGDVVLGESDPQHGSKFVVTIGVRLPKAQIVPQAILREEPPRPETPEASFVKSVSHGKVLIVDDAADNRTLIHHYVARLGYEADTAETGRDAVYKALNGDYDVILMDVQMPEMDGFEAVHQLRAQDYSKPIVALTAHTMKGDRERCLQSGFDDFLGKPVDRDLLRRSLERHTTHIT